MIGVALENEGPMSVPKTFSEWCAAHEVTWPQVLDIGSAGGSLSERLAISGIPMLLLIGSEGRVVAAGTQVKDVAAEIERLLPVTDAARGAGG